MVSDFEAGRGPDRLLEDDGPGGHGQVGLPGGRGVHRARERHRPLRLAIDHLGPARAQGDRAGDRDVPRGPEHAVVQGNGRPGEGQGPVLSVQLRIGQRDVRPANGHVPAVEHEQGAVVEADRAARDGRPVHLVGGRVRRGDRASSSDGERAVGGQHGDRGGHVRAADRDAALVGDEVSGREVHGPARDPDVAVARGDR